MLGLARLFLSSPEVVVSLLVLKDERLYDERVTCVLDKFTAGLDASRVRGGA